MAIPPDEGQDGEDSLLGWLQRPWWFLRACFRALSPARFSLFVALIGSSLFLFVQQGTEILRALAERDQDSGRHNTGHIVWFFGSLLLWSLESWYWARLLLNAQLWSGVPLPVGWQSDFIGWCRRHGPRIFGVLPPLAIAFACFFLAPQGYDTRNDWSAHPKFVLYCFGGVAVVMAVALYVGFILCRRWLIATGRATRDWAQPRDRRLPESHEGRAAWWAVGALGLLALGLQIIFFFRPVYSGLLIGSGAILCLAAAVAVCIGSVAVWLSDRFRLPFIGALVAWAVFCSYSNDNHLVRTLPAEPGTSAQDRSAKTPVAGAFIAWQQALPHAAATLPGAVKPLRPVFIVATEGGGIRAAYWTALVLATLQDESQVNARKWLASHPGADAPPDFASQLFAISGVSGGSLGAAVFDALVADNQGYPLAAKAGYMLQQDFLSPTLAAMLFPDMLQRFWFRPVLRADRARALEEGWEHGWALAVSGNGENRFARPFLSLWNPSNAQSKGAGVRLPALFLNGTMVETGKRIITSNLPITPGPGGEFSDADDAEAEISDPASSRRDLPLSTAAHMSARFTYVSPAGRLPTGGHVVDGGYFENSGATTALEVLEVVEGIVNQHPEWPERFVPVVIEIRNGPVSEPPGQGAKAAPPPKLAPHHELLGEVFDPLDTLLNARDARGGYSQAAIESEQQNTANGLPWTLFRFGLYESQVPLPLGWMLSGGAAYEMRRQLHAGDLGNQKTLDDITGLLLPAAPVPLPTEKLAE